jgi:hypothetical protein
MRKQKLLELSKKGTDFSFVVPANTQVEHLNEALALFILESAKYRGIKPITALKEIELWLTQLEENL